TLEPAGGLPAILRATDAGRGAPIHATRSIRRGTSMRKEHIRRRGGLVAAAVVASLGLVATKRVEAVDFSTDSFKGSWDTTLSYGMAWRIEDPDCHLIATADGGCGRSPNIDDGDLNYHDGIFSRAIKVVSELSLETEHF